MSSYLINNYCGLTLFSASNNIVSKNVIRYTHESGISIVYGTSNNILNNTLLDNSGGGISLDFSKNNRVYRNHVENNSFIGIWVGYSFGTKIYENNIINNKINAWWANTPLEFFLLWRNRWYNNYWGAPCTLPKLIFGMIYLGAIGNFPLGYPRVQYDLKPAQIPYDISNL